MFIESNKINNTNFNYYFTLLKLFDYQIATFISIIIVDAAAAVACDKLIHTTTTTAVDIDKFKKKKKN